MNLDKPVTVVGIASLDVTWNPSGESKMRLGGIVHSCRALWALGVSYQALYFAPDYLITVTAEYLHEFGAADARPIGSVTGAPSVMLIGSPRETASQKYEFLMRDTFGVQLSAGGVCALENDANEECLVIAGEFDVELIVQCLRKGGHRHIHLDLANSAQVQVDSLVETLITSTSSSWFLQQFHGSADDLATSFVPTRAKTLILKENRGGSRLYDGHGWTYAGAQLREVSHSVGVGDAFDAVYVAAYDQIGQKHAMTLASHVAAEYAATTVPDDFRDGVECITAGAPSTWLPGVICPWEERRSFEIYVAGPDFDYLDTKHIDAICDALRYHNFQAHRPVRENGQAQPGLSLQDRRKLFYSDLILLQRCQCIVAVTVPPDEGTLVEIGRAAEAGKPVILYAPGGRHENLMLVGSASEVASTLDQAIAAVFCAMDRWRRERQQ